MLTSMKNQILSSGLKKIEAKISFFNIIDVLKRMSTLSATFGIEPNKTDNSTSNPSNLSDTLKELCLTNAEFFKTDDTENGQRLHVAFLGLIDHVNNLTPQLNNIRNLMAKYDFDEQTPGNGYRSFVAVVDASMKHAIQLCKQINLSKQSFLFRKGFYMREVEAVCHMVASLSTCFTHLHTLLSWSEVGELFPTEEHSPEELLTQSDTINQYAFYGRCLGIQFCDSVQTILKSISILMASFSETYYSTGGFVATANCFFSSGKFLLDPELRARRIVNISQYAGVDFCKSFWFLAESELMRKLPNFVCPAIAVNMEIKIPPEPLKIENLNGELIDIPIPSSHIETSSIQVRLISNKKREGMISVGADAGKKNDVAPPSPGLIVHCHGGGFVAQSSKSHEVYLRNWANVLEVPILSVDYSLAPRAPFPRALEEVFYAYCWALKNCDLLGSRAERVILVGDSAGANLNLGIALKCIEKNIRKPAGMFLAYVPVLVSFVPSPARLLCLMDPLLPFGFMMRCLKAYACPGESGSFPNLTSEGKELLREATDLTSMSATGFTESETESFEEVTESDLMELVAHKSPVSDVSDTLTTVSLASSQHSKPEADQFFEQSDELNGDLKLDLSTDEKYIFDSEIKDGKKVAVIRTEKSLGSAAKERPSGLFRGMKDNMSNLISNTFTATAAKSAGERKSNVHILDSSDLKNPSEEFKFTVPKDPFLSPYWAPDEVLRQLPPTSICSVQFDPCLDDCVMFAKKLKRLGNSVKLDILDGLPHGFLNFAMISKDAEEGSKLCVKRIKDLLDMASLSCTQTETNETQPSDDP
ncbi:UNVERIFIED_CONTAM: hypothetical protein PYX00_002258 [Menopon gallinae]|uniref:Hormone-sensitive lipase n=1 Tax=Menopon gallinae TaxID=328185 RepID=A0AAW2IG61_9NEOP